MMTFLASLFGMSDRAAKAAERASLAIEGIADDLEQARAALREKLGLGVTPAPQLPAPTEKPNRKRN